MLCLNFNLNIRFFNLKSRNTEKYAIEKRWDRKTIEKKKHIPRMFLMRFECEAISILCSWYIAQMIKSSEMHGEMQSNSCCIWDKPYIVHIHIGTPVAMNIDYIFFPFFIYFYLEINIVQQHRSYNKNKIDKNAMFCLRVF